MSRTYLIASLAAIPSVLFFLVLGRHELAGEFVPQDIVSYLLGAERLISSGSPYLPAYRDLSVAVPFWLDWTTYNTTPLMAQLFIPIQQLNFTGAWYLWLALSFAALVGAATLGWRAGGGAINRSGVLLGSLLLLGITPITAGLVTGRPEFLIALAIGWALISDRAIIGLVIAALLRVTPVLLLLPYAISTGQPLRILFRGAVLGSLLLACLVLLAPEAWREFTFGGVGQLIFSMTRWPEMLSSQSGTPAPTLALILSGLPAGPFVPATGTLWIINLVSSLTSIGALALILLSLHWSRDRSRRHASLAAAAVALLFGFGVLFDYHAVILVPIAAASWAAGARRARSLLLGAALVGTLIPLEIIINGWHAPSWWHAISMPIALAVLEAARITRLPARAVTRTDR